MGVIFDLEERQKEYLQNITNGVKKLHDLNESILIIKDDAWIGACTIILKGVTIGQGAIIGAGSIVLHDVPDYVVVAGNPARIVKKLNIINQH
jgi:acetyltransferase-like isoleucine patch superfamily enzyme